MPALKRSGAVIARAGFQSIQPLHDLRNAADHDYRKTGVPLRLAEKFQISFRQRTAKESAGSQVPRKCDAMCR